MLNRGLIALLVLLEAFWLYGQDNAASDHPITRPSLIHEFKYESPGELIDTIGNFSFMQTAAGVNIPVWHTIKEREADQLPDMYLLMFSPKVGYGETAFDHLGTLHQLTSISVGLSGTYLNLQKQKLFFNYIGGFAFEDVNILSDPTPRFTLLSLYAKQFGRAFGVYVGGTYSYVFGTEIPLPILGFNVRVQETKFNFIFPYKMSLVQRFNEQWRLSFFLKLSGGMYGLKDVNNDYGRPDEKVLLRRRSVPTGAKLIWEPNNSWKMFVEGGFVTNRRVRVTSNSSDYIELFPATDVKEGWYVQTGIRFKFGRKSIADELDMDFEDIRWDDVNWEDFDLDDIELEDLEDPEGT